MDTQHQPLEAIQDIKRMMERSSRFISLSGWSGVSAGICALIGATVTYFRLRAFVSAYFNERMADFEGRLPGRNVAETSFYHDLIWIALLTFVAAAVTAFFFTYLRTRKQGVPIWDRTVQRLAWNTILPMAVGGLFILRAMELEYYRLVAPGCLIFYGLALVNASKYTLGEIRYLGYGQLVLGLINLWVLDYGLYFWAAGFGVLHILYGVLMWRKYERTSHTREGSSGIPD